VVVAGEVVAEAVEKRETAGVSGGAVREAAWEAVREAAG
jgi:hypothetical protein